MTNERYKHLQHMVETYLEHTMQSTATEYDVLFDAMRYAVLGGGKRLRAVLMLECGRICGIDEELLLPFAGALEMIHASTLIHDDLPCMDDDDYRRGKLACHKKFGEDVALLAGDALYSFALESVLKNTEEEHYCGTFLNALTVLIASAGADGVFGGQILDKKYEEERCTPTQLLQLHGLKTGALFSACARIPCTLGRADAATEKALRIYMNKLGLAFQVKDDLLDLEGSFETLGKAVGADENKSTFISIFGAQRSKEFLNELILHAKQAVLSLSENDLLLWICDFVMNREL